VIKDNQYVLWHRCQLLKGALVPFDEKGVKDATQATDDLVRPFDHRNTCDIVVQ